MDGRKIRGHAIRSLFVSLGEIHIEKIQAEVKRINVTVEEFVIAIIRDVHLNRSDEIKVKVPEVFPVGIRHKFHKGEGELRGEFVEFF